MDGFSHFVVRHVVIDVKRPKKHPCHVHVVGLLCYSMLGEHNRGVIFLFRKLQR